MSATDQLSTAFPLVVYPTLSGADDEDCCVTSFTAYEKMSGLFRYSVEIVSEVTSLTPTDVLGKNLTFYLREKSDAAPDTWPILRYFNGFVTSLEQGERFQADSGNGTTAYRIYRLEVAPWLWFLTLRTNCRIRQGRNVKQLVFSDVFGEIGTDVGHAALAQSWLHDDGANLTNDRVSLEYSCQFEETDYQYVCRLLEQEAIYYYFAHAEGQHRLIAGETASHYAAKDANASPVTYESLSFSEDSVADWKHKHKFRTGKFSQRFHDFERGSTSARRDWQTPIVDFTDGTQTDFSKFQAYERYEYGSGYGGGDANRPFENDPDQPSRKFGETLGQYEMQRELSAYELVTARSQKAALFPGCKFECLDADDYGETGQHYVVTGIRHTLLQNPQFSSSTFFRPFRSRDYLNTFECVPAGIVFAPPRQTPKPRILGPQTALVIGSDGNSEDFENTDGAVLDSDQPRNSDGDPLSSNQDEEDIASYANHYARIKVRMQWERRRFPEEYTDENEQVDGKSTLAELYANYPQDSDRSSLDPVYQQYLAAIDANGGDVDATWSSLSTEQQENFESYVDYESGEYDNTVWIRVSENWAGGGYGTVFAPRPGDEVVVEFLGGDPDRPIVAGRLYNEVHKPPAGIAMGKDTPLIEGSSGTDAGAIAADLFWWGKGDWVWTTKDPTGKVSSSQTLIQSRSLDGGSKHTMVPGGGPLFWTPFQDFGDAGAENRGMVVAIEDREPSFGVLSEVAVPMFNPVEWFRWLGGPRDGGWWDLFNDIVDFGVEFFGGYWLLKDFRENPNRRDWTMGRAHREFWLRSGAVFNFFPPGLRPKYLYKTSLNLPRERFRSADEHFNEIRFGDEKGKEFVYIHAEKDFIVDVETDYQLRAARNRNVLVDRFDKLVVENGQSVTINGPQTISAMFMQSYSVMGNRKIEVKGVFPLWYDIAPTVEKLIKPIDAFTKFMRPKPVNLLSMIPGAGKFLGMFFTEETWGEHWGNQIVDISNDQQVSIHRDELYQIGRTRVTVIGSVACTGAELVDPKTKVPSMSERTLDMYADSRSVEDLSKGLMETPKDVGYGHGEVPPPYLIGVDRSLIKSNRIARIEGSEILEVGLSKAQKLAITLANADAPNMIPQSYGERRILVHGDEEHCVEGRYRIVVVDNTEADSAADAFVPAGTFFVDAEKGVWILSDDGGMTLDVNRADEAPAAVGEAKIRADKVYLQGSDDKATILISDDGSIEIKADKGIHIEATGPTGKITLKAPTVETIGQQKIVATQAMQTEIDGQTLKIKGMTATVEGGILKLN